MTAENSAGNFASEISEHCNSCCHITTKLLKSERKSKCVTQK